MSSRSLLEFSLCIIALTTLLLLQGESSELDFLSGRPDPCQNCRDFVECFEEGMEKTEKGHYDGGDSAWEEEKQMVYRNSEVRLIEIQENMCKDSSAMDSDQCFEFAADSEDLLEEWWRKDRKAGKDLFPWLCINQLKFCCPDNHYGPDCRPCPLCSNRGECKGNGTRKGNGACDCDAGYTGKSCESCARNYYESYRDDTHVRCTACHKSCKGGCSGTSAQECVACKDGWITDLDVGCVDIDECLEDMNPCKKKQFCINTEGSYACFDCAETCESCFGDEPDMCTKCIPGMVLRDGLCTDLESVLALTSMRSHKWYKTGSRYLVYLGILALTGLILLKSVWIAAIVGTGLAAYVATSEYLPKSTNT